MTTEKLIHLAHLIAQRNRLAAEVTELIGRPMQIGHVGEFIAARVFDIKLADSATNKAIDGYFSSGPLSGRSVNVKWYAKREGLLDITSGALPDYYLVLAGPRSPAASSRGQVRPWLIESAHVFDSASLVARLQARPVRIGIATSVKASEWEDSEVFPRRTPDYPLSDEQRAQLGLFLGSD